MKDRNLKKLLLRYGEHRIGCSIRRNPAFGCSCGWTHILKELKEGKFDGNKGNYTVESIKQKIRKELKSDK